MLACRDITQHKLVELMIEYNADVNIVTPEGISALSMTVMFENKQCTEFLISKGSKIFNDDIMQRNLSPFIIGICLNH